MDEKYSTKETILKSAYDIFSKKGMLDTVKEIANQAGVNIAAINYYFGSKENLIDLVTEKYFDEVRGLFSILENSSEHPLQRIRSYIDKFMSLNVSPVHINLMAKAIKEDGKMQKFVDVVNEHADAYKNVIKEVTGEQDEHILNMKVILFASAITYPRLINNYIITPLNLDFSKSEIREKYIDVVMDILF